MVLQYRLWFLLYVGLFKFAPVACFQDSKSSQRGVADVALSALVPTFAPLTGSFEKNRQTTTRALLCVRCRAALPGARLKRVLAAP